MQIGNKRERERERDNYLPVVQGYRSRECPVLAAAQETTLNHPVAAVADLLRIRPGKWSMRMMTSLAAVAEGVED